MLLRFNVLINVVVLGALFVAVSSCSRDHSKEADSIAHRWNTVILDAIRTDRARPPIQARNLFHTSAAMYDAWAIFDTTATTYLLGKTVNGFSCSLSAPITSDDSQMDRQAAISYAAYRLIEARYIQSPGYTATLAEADQLMADLGYDTDETATDLSNYSPATLGNYIASCYIAYGLQDGSNEAGSFANLSYSAVNPQLAPNLAGNPDIVDMDRWQPLTLDTFIDQSGNVIVGGAASFLAAEWGNVKPFSLTSDQMTLHNRDNFAYPVYLDPGAPPSINGALAAEYQWSFALVAKWSSHLDPSDGVMMDISPANLGNSSEYPTNYEAQRLFYDDLAGGDHSTGRTLNPKTNKPYTPQIVPRGDYTRVLAEFWADGPKSETPPGHWFALFNTVSGKAALSKKFRGVGTEMDALEWDVKGYFALGGAMHDSAIAAWGIKGWYDSVRPISAIRAMADLGQSTSADLPHYNAKGLPLEPGFIELVEAGDPLAGENDINVNKIKIKAWKGPSFIIDPANDTAGVDWILAENWWPYQRPSFVTPPFAGFVSGHSTYSRAAAEVLTAITGDPYFPGGLGSFAVKKNEYLVFENGPTVDVTLQWATYRDAADQCSLSRIWGGIHPPMDDITGRMIGKQIGTQAVDYAEKYFNGTAQ